MPLKLTDEEKEIMERYELDESDMRAVRRACAADEVKRRSEERRLDEIAAKEAAKNKKDKEREDIEIL